MPCGDKGIFTYLKDKALRGAEVMRAGPPRLLPRAESPLPNKTEALIEALSAPALLQWLYSIRIFQHLKRRSSHWCHSKEETQTAEHPPLLHLLVLLKGRIAEKQLPCPALPSCICLLHPKVVRRCPGDPAGDMLCGWDPRPGCGRSMYQRSQSVQPVPDK